jgi:hypothetical protein
MNSNNSYSRYSCNIEDLAEFFISKFSDYMRNNFTFNIAENKFVVEEKNNIKQDITIKQEITIKQHNNEIDIMKYNGFNLDIYLNNIDSKQNYINSERMEKFKKLFNPKLSDRQKVLKINPYFISQTVRVENKQTKIFYLKHDIKKDIKSDIIEQQDIEVKQRDIIEVKQQDIRSEQDIIFPYHNLEALEEKYFLIDLMKHFISWRSYSKNEILKRFNFIFETDYTIKEINIIIPILFDKKVNNNYILKADIFNKY